MPPLAPTNRLDPRPVDSAQTDPLPGTVNIPLDELPARTHELPPRSTTIAVAATAELAAQTVAWLQRVGRRAFVAVETGNDPRPRSPADPSLSPRLRLWQPNALVARCAANVPAGQALDLACGTGRDAVHLATCGWQVTAADVLPDALARARDLEQRYAAGTSPINWQTVDLEKAAESCRGAYDLIIMVRFLHRPLLARLPEWLRPGGHVVVETFTIEHRRRYGRPSGAAAVLEPGELRSLVPGLRIIEYQEGGSDEAHTARLIAQRCPADRGGERLTG